MLDTRFPEVTWTTKIVQETLIEAAWYCVWTGGGAFPDAAETDFWDRISLPEDDAPKRSRRRLSPARVSFLERAMLWPVIYLKECPDEARMLQLWLKCKVEGLGFKDEVQRRGIARATAYRQRDRALTIISVSLDRDRVPLWGE